MPTAPRYVRDITCRRAGRFARAGYIGKRLVIGRVRGISRGGIHEHAAQASHYGITCLRCVLEGNYFSACLRKKSHITSFAEKFFVESPKKAGDRLEPGQV